MKRKTSRAAERAKRKRTVKDSENYRQGGGSSRYAARLARRKATMGGLPLPIARARGANIERSEEEHEAAIAHVTGVLPRLMNGKAPHLGPLAALKGREPSKPVVPALSPDESRAATGVAEGTDA